MNLRPLHPPEGTVQERHRIDREMDGVKQVKIWTIRFHKFRDIFKIFKRKGDGIDGLE